MARQMAMREQVRIGVDIGGTFTDVVASRKGTEDLIVAKVSTSSWDPSEGVLEGIREVLSELRLSLEDVELIVHATTLVTNALLERSGARTAMLTTRGFRDVLETGREVRYDLFDLSLEKPTPLVPRRLRKEVRERILSSGRVELPLDLDEVREIASQLSRNEVEAIAVCFLHSYANADHEKLTGQVLADVVPSIDVTLSSDIAPVLREYERFSTAVANAYVRPLIRAYIAKLTEALRRDGFLGSLLLMASNGGIVGVEEAKLRPVLLTESGPAAGAVFAARYARSTGTSRLLSFDMGGTTAKICFIDDAQPAPSNLFEVARVHRFLKGSGIPLSVPVIQMIEIGAGGGSIAHIDKMGLLKVGPRSAGAYPGPACYKRGGKEPTVTDADLVLGYLDPESFLGGTFRLDVDAARSAIERYVASPLGISLTEAALGIHEVVNAQMATAARVHAAETGRDMRDYTLMAFGGAGPVHAFGVCTSVGIPRFICPPSAGVASAVGLLESPLVVERARGFFVRLDRADWMILLKVFTDLEEEARKVLEASGGRAGQSSRVRYFAEMRYVGQGHEISVPVRKKEIVAQDVGSITRAFLREYRRLFGQTVQGGEPEILGCRAIVSSEQSWKPGSTAAVKNAAPNGRAGERRCRQVYFASAGGFVETPVLDRYRLSAGEHYDGPAVVEERESTTVAGPGCRFIVDDELNLIVTLVSS